MIRYKLVTQDYKTRVGYPNETTWEFGVTVVAKGTRNDLCTDGVIHSYEAPEIAAFMNPAHANIPNPRCLQMECSNLVANDGLKGGHKQVTPIKEVSFPCPTSRQYAVFAILSVQAIPNRKPISVWDTWAKAFLSIPTTSCDAAHAAALAAYAASDAAYTVAYAAARAAAYAASDAAYTAARAASDAAYAAARAASGAASAAAYAANAADYAAAAAAYAANANIDFAALAKQALTY